VSGPVEDPGFEEYLRGDSQVSRRYRELNGDEVPGHLDGSILAAAREAVQQPASSIDELAHVRKQQRRLMRWALPTTLAACTLLAVTVVMRSNLPHESGVQQASVRADAPAAPAPAARMEDKKTEQTQESIVLIAPPRNAVTEFSELAPATQDSARTARAREEMKHETRSVAEQAEASRRAMSERRVAVPAPSPINQNAAAEPALAAAAPAPIAVPQISEREAAAFSAPPAPAPMAKARDEVDLQEIAVTGARSAQPTRSGPRDTISGNVAQMSSDHSASIPRAPEDWLGEIRKLRQSGETERADREWREFRKQYPDYEVAATDLARGEQRK
jgi:hypothetical protein